MSQYIYSITIDTANSIVDLDKLTQQVEDSAIVSVLQQVSTNNDQLTIEFDSNLTAGDKVLLDGIVDSHDGIPLPEVPSEPTEVTVVKQKQIPAFASKTIPETGQKLFRRKHGLGWTSVAPNSSETITLVVPYTLAKIDEAELMGCGEGDCVDLKVHDNDAGTISTVPDKMLNQFGFDVCMPNGSYKDHSQYDADLILGMKVKLTYKNNSSTETRNIGVNITLHEVV